MSCDTAISVKGDYTGEKQGGGSYLR